MIEIARKDGVEFRSVRLRLEDDGGIKMDAQDIGPTVTRAWGSDDYEFWVRVPPASVSKLAHSNCCAKRVSRTLCCQLRHPNSLSNY